MEKLNNRFDFGRVLYSLGIVYLRNNNFKKAEEVFHKGQQFCEETQNIYYRSLIYYGMGWLEYIKNNFETNLFGPIEVMKAVLPQMRTQSSGLIINVTSIAGYMGLPYRSVYSASKGALELITEALRMEVKPFGIRLTNVAPGDFATNIASGRFHAPLIKGSAYEIPYGNTLKTMDEHVDSGSNPNEMAEAVYQIIQTSEPKIHYKVGAFMQKFSIALKRILPDKVYEKMLMNHYKL